MVVSKILATLPASYRHFANAWESTKKKDTTLENLTTQLIAEEIRNSTGKSEEKAVAFKAAHKKCNKYNMQGHLSKDCKAKLQNKEICYFKCNKLGHMARDCNDRQSRSKKFCNICKKNNHIIDKDCFYRKKAGNKKESTEKVS